MIELPNLLDSLPQSRPLGCNSPFVFLQSTSTMFSRINWVTGFPDQVGKNREFSILRHLEFGNARLRKSLFMVVLQLIRRNAWLRQYYERLRAAGKPGKVATIAAMRIIEEFICSILPVALDQLLATATVVPTTRNLSRRDPKLLIRRRASFLLQQTCEHPAISNLEGSAVAASPPAIIISWGESFFSSGTSSTAAAR
jgi:hypothetical protein